MIVKSRDFVLDAACAELAGIRVMVSTNDKIKHKAFLNLFIEQTPFIFKVSLPFCIHIWKIFVLQEIIKWTIMISVL